jgi:hypothetical protein
MHFLYFPQITLSALCPMSIYMSDAFPLGQSSMHMVANYHLQIKLVGSGARMVRMSDSQPESHGFESRRMHGMVSVRHRNCHCRNILTWPFIGKLLRSTFWLYHHFFDSTISGRKRHFLNFSQKTSVLKMKYIVLIALQIFLCARPY